MKEVEYLIGQENIKSRPMQPFSETACSFLHTLSVLLMQLGRQYPDVLTFAYWCRKANIAKLKAERSDLDYRIGRGLAFHITPSNIPINFAYSYAFSLLAGNANIVRVPSKPFPQIDLICEAINKALNDYSELAQSVAFVRYDSGNAEITAKFCAQADARIIWGGDDTIYNIVSMHAKPRCVDVAFADRYSLAIIDGNAVLQADKAKLKALSKCFYNDTYLMDQNACSSPQLILWINDSPEARDKFWTSVYEYAKDHYILQSAVAVDKYTKLFENILDTDKVARISYCDNYLYRIELCHLFAEVECMRGKAGYFYEYPISGFDELLDIVTDKYQTIVCFGVDMEALRAFVIEKRLHGIDRIVPIGAAMDIGIVWDGYDLISILSRIVALQ